MTMTINLFDLIAKADLHAALEAKLINIREDGAGLRILNYSDAAMYTPGAWESAAVRQCRGIIVDADWNVVARPWSKFFNHGQAEAGELDMTAPVEVTDKLDGSLGIIHLDLRGNPRVASRGSFESDQAVHATAVLHERHPHLDLSALDEITPLVEIIYPDNRIVVDYGDTDDLVLLGGVVIATGEYLSPAWTARYVDWRGPRADVFEYATLRDALEAEPRPGMEGLCVRYLDRSHIVKIKQPEYVALHRIVTGLSERSVWEHMSADLPLEDLLGTLPDELHQWTRDVYDRIDDAAALLEGRAHAVHYDILDQLGDDYDRGDYARHAKEHGPLTPLLFHLLDGRTLRPSVLRGLKPAGSVRARAMSEATA